MFALLATLALTVCPASASSLIVHVHDPSGAPLPDVSVVCDGRVSLTSAAGSAQFLNLSSGSDCTVRAALRPPVRLSGLELPDGVHELSVNLPLAPGSLEIVALDSDRRPVDARVLFLAGPESRAALQLGADGAEHMELTPGNWHVLVADGRSKPVEAWVAIVPGDNRSLVVGFPSAPQVMAEPVAARVEAPAQVPVHESRVASAPRRRAPAALAAVRLELPEIFIVAEVEPRALDLGLGTVVMSP